MNNFQRFIPSDEITVRLHWWACEYGRFPYRDELIALRPHPVPVTTTWTPVTV